MCIMHFFKKNYPKFAVILNFEAEFPQEPEGSALEDAVSRYAGADRLLRTHTGDTTIQTDGAGCSTFPNRTHAYSPNICRSRPLRQ